MGNSRYIPSFEEGSSADQTKCFATLESARRGGQTHLAAGCTTSPAAPLIKCREATEAAQTGWSVTSPVSECILCDIACERPPRPLHQRRLRDFFLMSRPPLLTRRGIRLIQVFVNSFTIDRRYSKTRFTFQNETPPNFSIA